MEKENELKNLLVASRKIAITVHKRPDGDAIGSALALANLCQKLGDKEVTIVSPTIYPRFLSWMPGIENIIVAEKNDPQAIKKILHQADLLVCLDFGEYHRVGNIADDVRTTPARKVIIDHHPEYEDMQGMMIRDPEAAATALMLHDLFVAMDFEKLIDKEVATALYIGIATDTGFFSNSNTSASAHSVAAKLIEKGVDVGIVNYHLQGNAPLRKLLFMAHVIRHRLVVSKKHGFAYLAIPRADFRKFNLGSGETGGLVQYIFNIEGVTVAVLLTEQKESVHLSFRSFGEKSVNKFATEHFNGGGHKNAAGGIYHGTLPKATEKLDALLIREFSQK